MISTNEEGICQQEDRQIDGGLVREVVTLVQTQVQGEVSQLQTEDGAGGRPTCRFESTKLLNP
ncbi:hypothetical protein Bca52824_083051 [Brassica carinata]|uniref:Uncharacterized protein n=1 Tax=Brassica carinata TaxID=52824 RepID=A0A8X7TSH3_BRACI|nr:hypothetical protein Bca52824_083051 [Brassica carinata]